MVVSEEFSVATSAQFIRGLTLYPQSNNVKDNSNKIQLYRPTG